MWENTVEWFASFVDVIVDFTLSNRATFSKLQFCIASRVMFPFVVVPVFVKQNRNSNKFSLRKSFFTPSRQICDGNSVARNARSAFQKPNASQNVLATRRHFGYFLLLFHFAIANTVFILIYRVDIVCSRRCSQFHRVFCQVIRALG